ncbi:kazal-type serine protease inhibitor domain protein [Ichthyophthirius multifiliis]|uniref:Kazal-type serine protease inhibitor domain protein n=1 Tax=Ichthyophthirius multifiliis TaxID=5932 RepID=G0R140_ICHMU|nr:kazal-type serine protease inhibitor domain protein [Ichthyophthirius multifiliis]EGR28807.1 kazal-type serine protease inhibitor domain protein [Ichthyophthirius multifiliis]|eukprot:XP_004030043.1 kazal-type serine protease inhibitor domain protein [Ichthyophthirius multifiliis]
MQKILILFFILLAQSFAFYQDNQPYRCTEQQRAKNFRCTREAHPVCGIQQGSQPYEQIKVDQSNVCMACSELANIFLFIGPCNRIPSGAQVCDPDYKGLKNCPTNKQQVCGYRSNGIGWHTFLNECKACSKSDVVFFKQGKCPVNTF